MSRRQTNFYRDDQNEITKFFKILIGLVIIVGLMYFLTNYVANKGSNFKRTNNKGKINYDVISLGTLFNMPDAEYYVLVFDEYNIDNNTIRLKALDYKSSKNSITLYTSDINSELNKSFISDTSSYKENDIDALKISKSTLIKIKNKKIVKFIDNEEDILNELK